MTIFDVLNMIGGLCLFLFGMNVMGDGLERRAGNSLKALLGKLTDSKIKGFLTGQGVTGVIQSSSATTVMVVGFVNSRLMTLRQSIGVIMGAMRTGDWEAACSVEPLEQVIDHLRRVLRNRHISRLKKGECSVEAGFIWSDLLTDVERISDHCSNIARSIPDAHEHNMNAHQSLHSLKNGNPDFLEKLDDYSGKYLLPGE